MNAPDPFAERIAWFAQDTLDASERRDVEAHLQECGDCRALLAHARLFRTPGADAAWEEDHIQAQLLVQHVDAPESLDRDVQSRIGSHLQTCAVCREARDILDDLSSVNDAPVAAVAPESTADPFWWRLRVALQRSLLGPVPAAAYLLLVLVLAYPAYRQLVGPPGGAGDAPEVPTVLTDEVRLRRAEVPTPADVPIRPGADAASLVLELHVDPDELAGPGAELVLTIEMDGARRLELRRPAQGIGPEVSWPVLLPLSDADRMAGDPVLTATVRVERPEDDLAAVPVFQRSFRLVDAAAP